MAIAITSRVKEVLLASCFCRRVRQNRPLDVSLRTIVRAAFAEVEALHVHYIWLRRMYTDLYMQAAYGQQCSLQLASTVICMSVYGHVHGYVPYTLREDREAD
jgi:hypothetical protein